ncbi:MAG TPA: 2-C-methyl-D-erythritol 4-phosphate cytidylyltransferase [Kiritimatiellia bacterium]|nr:2-C-methyl-D-erythritol 4-phosphate cytidylyltransferase [Kiritimatiellia bacterium]HMO98028.1 2-C-methyl-D-erythritol 4-phosphate cytidylyltransferase [Kiritimatiellia bacterium]HMP96553.1 2-C-methyl-D-erythritol 4-phosphate cytidylyltransferase [Kiritimatiellia bacterium]
MTGSTWAVVVASGKDEMLNAETCTAFLNLHNQPVLSYSLIALEHCPEVDAVVVVAPKDRLEQVVSVIQLFGIHKVRKVVPGGANELASFAQARKYFDSDATMIVVHEASRPRIQATDLSEIIKTAKRQGSAMMGKAVPEATASVEKNGAVETFHPGGLVWMYAFPLAVKAETLEKAEAHLRKKKKTVKTILEELQVAGSPPKIVAVKAFSSRIGTIDDLRRMEQGGGVW